MFLTYQASDFNNWEKWEILLCFDHTQWEVFFQIKFHPRLKLYSFHHWMKLTCKQKVFHPGTSFIPGWDFISLTCKRTLFTREFHTRMKRVEFHYSMKSNLKENLPLTMKTYNEIYHWVSGKLPPRKLSPWEKYPQWNPPPTYKSYKWKKKQNYQIFCLEESCAMQHPYQNNQGPLWYTNDLTENTGLRYFLYRMKKIQISNESENRQVAFTCQLY